MKRIKMVKFYQGVLLGKDTLASFTPDDLVSDKVVTAGRTAEITERGVVVATRDSKMEVLVPWNNVAYVQFIEVETAKVAKAK